MIFVGTFNNGGDLQAEIKKVIDEKMNMCWEYKKTHITSAISVTTSKINIQEKCIKRAKAIIGEDKQAVEKVKWFTPTQKEEIYHSAWVEFIK